MEESTYGEFTTGVDRDEYSLDNYYVSELKRGESEMMRLRVPTRLLRQMQEMIHGGKYPFYRTYTDIMRDALVHRLKYLSGKDPEINALFEGLIRQEITERRKTQVETVRRFVEDNEYILKGLRRGQDDDEIEDILANMRGMAALQIPSLSKQIMDMVHHYE